MERRKWRRERRKSRRGRRVEQGDEYCNSSSTDVHVTN